MMVILHHDGSDCRHDGPPSAAPWRCGAGIEVTHVKVNGHAVPVEQAIADFRAIIDRCAAILAPHLGGPRAGHGDPVGDGPLNQLPGQLTLPLGLHAAEIVTLITSRVSPGNPVRPADMLPACQPAGPVMRPAAAGPPGQSSRRPSTSRSPACR